jgi:hypothetical protein
VTQQRRIRWYNPALGCFEWRTVPGCDDEALSLLCDYLGAEDDAAVYTEWRELGAGILGALIRAGEAARDRRELRRP